MLKENDVRFIYNNNHELCNAIDNVDFLLTKMNVSVELYEILIRFRNDLTKELKIRGVKYG